ncbi:hypothetical protein CDD80_4928 [Ophiocordyceps camponoti-rufipedis]|uniref:Uncharacterized protein n=1 Tax=Ophiocordyceps camponoti-rufipedis TaxID=2004952 RepID=A0A2C5YVU4_9HYPO|nr:hypothetical protein CDD80_4928 [Ophiocordyceps camponoti-rufipedis]
MVPALSHPSGGPYPTFFTPPRCRYIRRSQRSSSADFFGRPKSPVQLGFTVTDAAAQLPAPQLCLVRHRFVPLRSSPSDPSVPHLSASSLSLSLSLPFGGRRSASLRLGALPRRPRLRRIDIINLGLTPSSALSIRPLLISRDHRRGKEEEGKRKINTYLRCAGRPARMPHLCATAAPRLPPAPVVCAACRPPNPAVSSFMVHADEHMGYG